MILLYFYDIAFHFLKRDGGATSTFLTEMGCHFHFLKRGEGATFTLSKGMKVPPPHS